VRVFFNVFPFCVCWFGVALVEALFRGVSVFGVL
jgi:hypothetical protein